MFKTIRSRILALIIGLMVVATFALVFLTVQTYEKQVQDQYDRLAGESLDTVMRLINTKYHELLSYELDAINHQRALLKEAATGVLSLLSAYYDLESSGGMDRASAQAQCLNFLFQQPRSEAHHCFVFDASLTGLFHPRQDMQGRSWEGFEDLKKEDALKRIKKSIGSEKQMFTVFKWPRIEDLKPVKQMAYFVYFPQWNWIIGAAADLEKIEQISKKKEQEAQKGIQSIIRGLNLNAVGGILIFNSQGRVIMHNTDLADNRIYPAGHILEKTMLKRMVKVTEGNNDQKAGFELRNHKDERIPQTAYVSYLKYKDWYVAALIDDMQMIKPVKTMVKQQLMFLSLILLAGMITAILMSGRLAVSIKRLAGYAIRLPEYNFKKGENPALERIISGNPHSEIDQLAKAFLYMETKLGEHLKELEDHKAGLETIIQHRTRELTRSNTALKQEIADRKQIEADREALIRELKEALDNVKTLSGMLPICSSCKKIRDDQGYWNSLEAYIEKRADVLFSHGMCKECSDKYYGGKRWYKKPKG